LTFGIYIPPQTSTNPSENMSDVSRLNLTKHKGVTPSFFKNILSFPRYTFLLRVITPGKSFQLNGIE